MAVFLYYHVPLKLTMHHTVITKREKKLMKIYKATDVPSHLQHWVNPDYVLLLSDTPNLHPR